MEILWRIFNSQNQPIIGEETSVYISIRKGATGEVYDWTLSSFVTTSGADSETHATEVDSTYFPGLYRVVVDTSTWDDGVYTIFGRYSSGPLYSQHQFHHHRLVMSHYTMFL